MPNLIGVPINNGERLYRRIPKGWYQPGATKQIPQRAFMPRPWESELKPGDPDGVSISRADLTTIEKASTTPSGKKCHLGEFGLTDVQRLNLTVAIKPTEDDPSHAIIPELNSIDLRDQVKAVKINEWAIALRDNSKLVFEA